LVKAKLENNMFTKVGASVNELHCAAVVNNSTCSFIRSFIHSYTEKCGHLKMILKFSFETLIFKVLYGSIA